jgi:hypothetical protein
MPFAIFSNREWFCIESMPHFCYNHIRTYVPKSWRGEGMDIKNGRFVLELDLKLEPFEFHILEKRFEIGRQISNACKGVMKNQLKKLKKDPHYQFWLKSETTKKRSDQLNSIRNSYGLSKTGAEQIVKDMGKHYSSKMKRNNGKPIPHLDSHTVQKIAEDVWQSVSDVLFGNGKKLHFKKYGEMKSLESKTNKSGIRYINGKCVWNGLKIAVHIDKKDTYTEKSLHHEIAFCRIRRKVVRGKVKFYLQLILKGIPPQKHKTSQGDIGLDIGISTLATVSDDEAQIGEFCEKVVQLDKEKRRIQRKMDRSRRATNPKKFNTDGTIKKNDKNQWKFSKRYKRLRNLLREQERKLAAVRRIEHNKVANRVLSKGNKVFCENMNYKGLQKGLFGKRIGMKAPSTFLSILERKLGYQGKFIYYVDTWKVRASQYDPYTDIFVKKRLSERFHLTGDGYKIQRDVFSAWLIKNVNENLNKVDRIKCLNEFKTFYKNYLMLEEKLKKSDKERISSIGF